MFRYIYFKSDLKKLIREPMMAFLFILPFVLAIIFKMILVLLVPLISNYIDFDISSYESYIMSLALIINPGILGMVVGFMLLDDKDNRIIELMSITPIGRKGYIIIRLTFVFISTFIYTIYSYFVVNLSTIPVLTIIYIAILLSMYGSLISMILSLVASDKVKGLTYAKALNMMLVFAFADLIDVKYIQVISSLFPTYWITKIIIEPTNLAVLSIGGLVHIIWFGLCFLAMKDSK